jgi:hypothetical protein
MQYHIVAMTHSKRTKSNPKTNYKHIAAKQAAKKKYKGASKVRNDELRIMLNAETPTIYAVGL